ncbi:MAG: hypothetical protein ACO1SV_11285 [Fimbriimonas sp.]
MAKRGRLKKIGIGCLGLVVVVALLTAFTPPGKAVQDLWRNGAIQALFFPEPKRTYDATNESNLEALHTALLLYHDSEGQFPAGNGWMDAIQPRIATSDLAKGEAEKKLVRPDLAGQADKFGYALNAKAAGKYKDDVGDGKTVLIYESKATGRNASGDPVTDRDGMAVTIDGTILKPGTP